MPKITPQMIEYYTSEPVSLTVDDWQSIENPAKIDKMAINDILGGLEKRTRKSFKTEGEYKYYLFALYEEAMRARYGLDVGGYAYNDD